MNPKQKRLLTRIIVALVLFVAIEVAAQTGILRAAFGTPGDVYAEFALFLIPYLIAVLVAIAVFRASGAMDFLIDGIRMGVSAAGLDTQFVEGLPTMLMKPLSGSGARGMMLDAMNTYGADSFIGRLCSIVQGSSDTTFYVVALYFGSVGIRNTYYTIPCSLLADLAGAVAAVTMTYLFFT